MKQILNVAPLSKTRNRESIFTYRFDGPGLKSGDLVEINLANRNLPAVVIGSGQNRPNLKPLNRVIYHGLLSETDLNLASWLTRHYYCSLSQALAAMIGQVKFRRLIRSNTKIRTRLKPAARYLITACSKERYQQYRKILNRHRPADQVLIIFPSQLRINQFQAFVRGISVGKLLEPTESFGLAQTQAGLLVGLRHAILLPYQNLKTLIIDDYNSGSYQERRAPVYNVNEVARFRQTQLGFNLIFGGEETAAELELDRQKHTLIKVKSRNLSPNLKIYPTTRNDIFNWEISDKLQRGKWLIFVPAKGEGRLVWCRVCHALVRCSRCQQPVRPGQVKCSNCQAILEPLACPICASQNYSAFGWTTQKARVALKKLGLSDNQIVEADQPEPKSRLIIATQKIFDYPELWFDNCLILDPRQFLLAGGYRRQEAAAAIFAKIACQTAGQIFLPTAGIDQAILGQLIKPNWAEILKLRRQYHLPPFSTIVDMCIDKKNLAEFIAALKDNKIPYRHFPKSDQVRVDLTSTASEKTFDHMVANYFQYLKIISVSGDRIEV